MDPTMSSALNTSQFGGGNSGSNTQGLAGPTGSFGTPNTTGAGVGGFSSPSMSGANMSGAMLGANNGS